MFVIFYYVVIVYLALMGIILFAMFYVAMWVVAAVIAILVWAFRVIRGQRGEQLWRRPFTPPTISGVKRAVSQAQYSDRR